MKQWTCLWILQRTGLRCRVLECLGHVLRIINLPSVAGVRHVYEFTLVTVKIHPFHGSLFDSGVLKLWDDVMKETNSIWPMYLVGIFRVKWHNAFSFHLLSIYWIHLWFYPNHLWKVGSQIRTPMQPPFRLVVTMVWTSRALMTICYLLGPMYTSAF